MAIWSGRLAAFAVQVVILAALFQRFEVMSTPVVLNLFFAGFILAGLSVFVGFLAYILIWKDGGIGFGRASFGILLGGLVLLWPGIYVPKLVALPVINDVSTDTANPPRFANVMKARYSDTNPVVYPGQEFAVQQQKSYPDIKPLTLNHTKSQVFDTARMIMKKREWTILGETRPGKAKSFGQIEAVDRTLVLGFSDDIVVRVGGKDGQAKIDVRSASRYGKHDFGRNAERIRGFLKELHARLDAGEDLELDNGGVAAVKRSGKKKLRAKKASRKKYVRKRRASPRARKRKVWRRLRKQRRYRYKPYPVY